MAKKIVVLLLAVIFCVGVTIPVSAESKAMDFVIDEYGLFSQGEIESLNRQGLDIYEATGVGVFYVFTQEEDLTGYAVDSVVNGLTDYVVMLENRDGWYTFYGGLGTQIDPETEEMLRDAYDSEDTYVGGVRAFMGAAEGCFPASTEIAEGESLQELSQVYDEAYLLSAEENDALAQKLLAISEEYQAEVVVATINSMNGGDIDDFVEYLYDSMDFGYGSERDGVLLLVCMNPREYRILGNGYAGTAIGIDEIEKIGDVIVSDLSNGYYASAFDSFADRCAYYLDGYLHGFPFNVGKNLLIALVIGVVAGIVVALVLKNQLKSVRRQNQANAYVKSGSLAINVSNDLFLYRTVSRRRKENKSSGSRSSGSSRSVGGGSF